MMTEEDLQSYVGRADVMATRLQNDAIIRGYILAVASGAVTLTDAHGVEQTLPRSEIAAISEA